jgi:5'-methylthioadenosine phosphorylase
MNIDLAIIGGTGFYHPGILKDSKEITINTAFGETQLIAGTYKGVAMAFLARHGREHAVPPHRINYRANIAALKEIGAQRVLSATAVGSLKEQLPPGVLVITDQFIEQIPDAIIAAQSPEVDAVTGATMTSNGIMEAVANAINQ